LSAEESPLVSAVVATHNGKEYLRECLRSLMAVAYPRLEVVVVDNASADGSALMVTDQFPVVKIVSSGSNLGWAGGNNLGIISATGRYILFLNNDAVVDVNVLMRLVEVAEKDQKIGVLGCKIYFPGGATVQHAGGLLRPSGDTLLVGYGQNDHGQFDVMRDVDWVSGAAIMVRRDVIDMVGGFDTFFGLYYEEADLCLRARELCFRVVYVPDAIVYHRMSVTIDRTLDDLSKYYRYQRSRLVFVIKNFRAGLWLKWAAWEMRNLAIHIAAAILGEEFRCRGSRPDKLWALFQAYYWILVNLPAVLRLRSQRRRSPKRR